LAGIAMGMMRFATIELVAGFFAREGEWRRGAAGWRIRDGAAAGDTLQCARGGGF